MRFEVSSPFLPLNPGVLQFCLDVGDRSGRRYLYDSIPITHEQRRVLKSSLAKKYVMAVVGLFLCLFLAGHLAGNLQLLLKTGEAGQQAFNEYAES